MNPGALPYAKDVKFNCDVSDAQFWGYYSICGLLLRYRDLYRDEHGLQPWDEVVRSEIGTWIQAKEAAWPALESAALKPVVIDGRPFDPFDAEAINRAVANDGLVYGAGYGMFLKPTFFLADLRESRMVEGQRVCITGRERVRDLFSAPGMQQNGNIVVRTGPLAAFLWDKLQEGMSRPGSPAAKLVEAAGVRPSGDGCRDALGGLVTRAADLVLLHELAEASIDTPRWRDLLAAVTGNRDLEHFVRSVKDLAADTAPGGPLDAVIGSRDRPGALLLSVLQEGHRNQLFPELRRACEDLLHEAGWTGFDNVRERAHERFRSLLDRIIRLHSETGEVPALIVRLRLLMQGEALRTPARQAAPASAAGPAEGRS